MPKKTDPYTELEEQVQAQIDLLEEVVSDTDPASRLARLGSATRALLNILRSLKTLRELSAAAADPTALLRKALEELEEEWPELRSCKEMLRSGGAIGTDSAINSTEATDAARA